MNDGQPTSPDPDTGPEATVGAPGDPRPSREAGSPATAAGTGDVGTGDVGTGDVPAGEDAAPSAGDEAAASASGGDASRTSNPFADLRAGDLIRDAVAVTLLLISFGMPWDVVDASTGRLYVVFATLLSIASVALPYLRRGGILPAAWTDATIRGARLIANVPYAAVVVVTIVLGYVGDAAGAGAGDGLGIGVAFGTAGAVLAAQPRSFERPSEESDAGLWRLTILVLGGLTAVLTVLSLVFVLVDSEGAEWADIVYVVAALLFFAVVALIPVAQLLQGDGSARDVIMVLGAVGLLAGFWLLGADSGGGVWLLRYEGPVLVFWPALAAAASAASLPVVLTAVAGSRRWIALALRLFQLAVVAAGLIAVLSAVEIARDEVGRGAEITLLVIALLALIAALIGRNAVAGDPRTGRSTALVAAGAFVVVGIVYAAVSANTDTGFDRLAAVVVSILFAFAGAIGYALLAPPSVREDLGPVGAVSPSFLRSRSNGSDRVADGGATASGQGPGAGPSVPGDGPVPPDGGSSTPGGGSSASTGGSPLTGASSASAGSSAAGSSASAGQRPRAAARDDDPEATVVAEGLGSDVTGRTSSAIGPDDATRVDVWIDPQSTAGAGHATPPPADTSSGQYTAQQAADPATPLQVLADIAGSEPALRPYVAANPSAYAELLAWLGQLGDPAVDEALRRRRR